MYTIKNIEINGMRKVHHESLDINGNTYIHGPNGSGKSTVLNAAQLCLLGYIPGQAKSNSAIMANANSPLMSVSVVLQGKTPDDEVKITRSFQKRGNSVQSALDFEPEGDDTCFILSDMDLPVFDWGEFESLSSNKAKEWFIKRFMSSTENKIDWKKELNSTIEDDIIFNTDIVDKYAAKIKSTKADSLLDTIVKVNDMVKNDVGYVKAAISEKQGTLNELSLSDIGDIDVDAINKHIDDCKEKLACKKSDAESAKERYNELTRTQDENFHKSVLINKLSAMILSEEEKRKFSDDIDKSNKRIAELDENRIKFIDMISSIDSAIESKNKLKIEAAAVISSANKIISSDGICPFTSDKCDSILTKIEKLKSDAKVATETIDGIDNEIIGLNDRKKFYQDEVYNVDKRKIDLESDIKIRKSALEKSSQFEVKVASIGSEEDFPFVDKKDIDAAHEAYSSASVDAANLESEISKSNMLINQYRMIETISHERDELQERLSILNGWVKLTGANGLQSKISKEAFTQLQDKLDDHIKKIFDDGSKSKFIIKEKANSFSFGIERGKTYIPYASLSTGEKAMYAFSLMLLVLSESACRVKTMFIDDIIDHLDAKRFDSLMSIVSDQYDVQIIMAGVLPCDSKYVQVVEME